MNQVEKVSEISYYQDRIKYWEHCLTLASDSNRKKMLEEHINSIKRHIELIKNA